MKSVLKLIALSVVLTACGGKDSNQEQSQAQSKELGNFSLVFPDNNLICTEGDDKGNNEVAINFLWNRSSNATSYNLEIKNQDNQEVTNISSNLPEKVVTLARDSQFSWTVTAILGDKSKKSEQWNFYSEGTAQDNFAPFPAEISIEDNRDGTVKINWPSTDLDDDIKSYHVFFGTQPEPEPILENVTYTSLMAQSISYNTDYYLKVITTDLRGNTATSSRQFNFSN